MIIHFNKLTSIILLISCLGYQSDAFSAAKIHFSKYRFIFDDTHRKDSLMLSNMGLNNTSCSMSTVNFVMSEKGPTKLAKSDKEVSNPANNLIRFSPRRVSIAPNQNQIVRITSRRKPNLNDGEFLSYLKIDCKELNEQDEELTPQITVKPKFIYYIPLQVRSGKLVATTLFNNIKTTIENKITVLSFDHVKTGNRSIIGEIKVIEKSSGNELAKFANTVIYTPFTKKSYRIKLAKPLSSPIEIIFTEDASARGNLIGRTEFTPKIL
jgi:hypothetical protein